MIQYFPRKPNSPSRNADYIGGHIRGAKNFPSRTFDAMLPTLLRQLQDKETVVFHCALSQQRGPGAALRYIRERERLFPSKSTKLASVSQDGLPGADSSAGDGQTAENSEEEKEKKPVEQKVYVLDRGFVGWQEVYGSDERLTEGYRADLWADGYWG